MKMKITYKPDAADRQEWVFDRDNPPWDVSYGAEKATDWGWPEFLARLDRISPAAWRALLWTLRKRDEPRLQLDLVEIDDWTQLRMEFQCPACEEWVSMQQERHQCAAAEGSGEQPPEPEKPSKKKKAGDSDPEA